MTIDYLVIGHVAKDNIPDGAILGGTCSYSALTAHKLGVKTGAVTSVGPDIPSMEALEGVALKTVPAPHSTTFENIYHKGQRFQRWLATSAPLSLKDVPLTWRNAPIVHLAPIAQEMSPSLCRQFPNSLVCVTIQGWLRGQDIAYNVIYQPHTKLKEWLSHIDVLVVSLADLFGDQTLLNNLLTTVKIGVETMGKAGCRVFHKGVITHVPVKPEIETDPTGAGDIFSTAFFIKYHQTKDPILAAQFANATASLSVQGIGLASIPTLSAVEKHLTRTKIRYQ